jgi:drug/metabolite transporter (DMT)-like permease
MVFDKLKALSYKESFGSSRGSSASLSIALFALSFAAIFIKLSEEEIGPGATVFNRLWIAAIVLWGWNWIDRSTAESNNEPDVKLFPQNLEILLLILVGIVGTASVMCWAWSLTRTSVANSTLMRNLSPLFTCLQGWLFFKQKYTARFIRRYIFSPFARRLVDHSCPGHHLSVFWTMCFSP